MRPVVLALSLSWPRTAADRIRMVCVAGSVALAGTFLMVAARVAQLGYGRDLSYSRYSNYLAEAGLRGGVTFAAAVVAVPALFLTRQALRLGTVARDRRLAALRVAGATPSQVRRFAAVEAGAAGLAGGLLAGPLYVLLTVVVTGLPRTARFVPPPSTTDVVVWCALVVMTTSLGVAAGWLVHRSVIHAPLTASRSSQHPASLLPAAVAVGLAIVLLGGVVGFVRGWSVGLVLGCAVLLAGAVSSSRVVQWRAGSMRLSSEPAAVLAGARLLADARSVARPMPLLLLCGGVLGFVTLSAAQLSTERGIYEAGFHLTGLGMTAVLALFAIAVITLSLTIGAADEVLRQHRQLASLMAAGMEVRRLHHALRLQLTAVAPWVTAVGALAGAVLSGDIASLPLWMWLPMTAVAVAAAGGLTWLGCTVAAQLLHGQLRDAVAPENLRAV